VSERRYNNITDLWPRPPATMIQRLQHTLDVWGDYPDDFVILIATQEVYGPHVTTGLTIGDLRELFRRENLGADTVLRGGTTSERLRDRLREDVRKNGPPPGSPQGDQ
jgi:hypothetical protein